MADFALFPREKTHKPTFCVWELAPVWHEQQAWVRFLKSARDEAAAQAWLGDSIRRPGLRPARLEKMSLISRERGGVSEGVKCAGCSDAPRGRE